MAVWWDGDLLREMLNKNVVSKYDWKTKSVLFGFFEGDVKQRNQIDPCLQRRLGGRLA